MSHLQTPCEDADIISSIFLQPLHKPSQVQHSKYNTIGCALCEKHSIVLQNTYLGGDHCNCVPIPPPNVGLKKINSLLQATHNFCILPWPDVCWFTSLRPLISRKTYGKAVTQIRTSQNTQDNKNKPQLSLGSGSHQLLPGRSFRSSLTSDKGKTERARRERIVSNQETIVKSQPTAAVKMKTNLLQMKMAKET